MSDTIFPSDWETKHAFMRANGLSSAKWETVLDPVGCRNHEVLREAVCGPAVLPPTEEEKYAETQPSTNPHERARAERQARRDLVARSSGGPVPRLDDVR